MGSFSVQSKTSSLYLGAGSIVGLLWCLSLAYSAPHRRFGSARPIRLVRFAPPQPNTSARLATHGFAHGPAETRSTTPHSCVRIFISPVCKYRFIFHLSHRRHDAPLLASTDASPTALHFQYEDAHLSTFSSSEPNMSRRLTAGGWLTAERSPPVVLRCSRKPPYDHVNNNNSSWHLSLLLRCKLAIAVANFDGKKSLLI